MGARGGRGGGMIAPTGGNGVEYWIEATAPRLGGDFAFPPAVLSHLQCGRAIRK